MNDKVIIAIMARNFVIGNDHHGSDDDQLDQANKAIKIACLMHD